MKAYCTIRPEPQYRRAAFESGLAALGFQVYPQHTLGPGRPGDVLVIWNRYAGLHETACRFEREGGTVIVAENGYLANDRFNRTRYAIALHGHNGQGAWHVGDTSRLQDLNVELQPWRESGEHILVCPNRCFGHPKHIMPPDWPITIQRELRALTKRPIRLRAHPGESRPSIPLADDLRNCWAMVTWYSSAGIEALVSGIPVFQCAPNWVAQRASCKDLSLIETPPLLDRVAALTDVAWAQWHIEEIASGTPFQYLLNRPHPQPERLRRDSERDGDVYCCPGPVA